MNRALLVALILGLALSTAACSSDSGADTSQATPPTVAGAATPVRSPTLPASSETPPTAATPPLDGTTGASVSTIASLTLGDPVPFPEGYEVLVTAGCSECSGPQITGIERLTMADAGIQRIELLDGQISDVLASADGDDIFALDCVAGSCGYVEGPRIAPTFAVVASNDGGESWSEVSRGASLVALEAITGNDALAWEFGPAETLFKDYLLVKAGTRVLPPEPGLRPIAGPEGLIWWSPDGRLLTDGGLPFPHLPGIWVEGAPEVTVRETRLAADGGQLAIRWEARSPAGPHFLLSTLDASGDVRTFRTRGNDDAILLNVGGWLDGERVVGTLLADAPTGYTTVLAVIDLGSGTVHPVMDDGAEVRVRSVIGVARAE